MTIVDGVVLGAVVYVGDLADVEPQLLLVVKPLEQLVPSSAEMMDALLSR